MGAADAIRSVVRNVSNRIKAAPLISMFLFVSCVPYWCRRVWADVEGGSRSRWDENNRLKKPRSEEDGAKEEGTEDADREERKPKRKVAVMIGYCGTGYKGMQLNPPHKSIEGDIFEALVKAGAISRANSNDPRKVCCLS